MTSATLAAALKSGAEDILRTRPVTEELQPILAVLHGPKDEVLFVSLLLPDPKDSVAAVSTILQQVSIDKGPIKEVAAVYPVWVGTAAQRSQDNDANSALLLFKQATGPVIVETSYIQRVGDHRILQKWDTVPPEGIHGGWVEELIGIFTRMVRPAAS